MKQRHTWIPALTAILLVVLVIGIPASGQAEPRVTTRTMTIPAGAFSPTSHEWIYGNSGRALYSTGGHARFTAPLFFPRPTVTITKMTLYGYDNDASANLCIQLFRTRPMDTGGPEDSMGRVCTSGASTLDPRKPSTASFNPNQITPTTGPYLWLEINGIQQSFYAVVVTYTY